MQRMRGKAPSLLLQSLHTSRQSIAIGCSFFFCSDCMEGWDLVGILLGCEMPFNAVP
jgi:hypothetical protein